MEAGNKLRETPRKKVKLKQNKCLRSERATDCNDNGVSLGKACSTETHGQLYTLIQQHLEVILDHLMPLVTHDPFDYKSLRYHGNPLRIDLYNQSFARLRTDLIYLRDTGTLTPNLQKRMNRIRRGVKQTKKLLKGIKKKSRRVIIEQDPKQRSIDIPSVDMWILGVILHTMVSTRQDLIPEFMCAYRTSQELKTTVANHSYYAQQVCKIAKVCMFILGLDIKDAYGQIPHETIRKAFKYLNFHPHDIEVIIKTVSINSVRYSKKKQHYYCVKNKGISQGNPLSPLVWNITMGYCLQQVKIDDLRCAAYGDDIVLGFQSYEEAEKGFKALEHTLISLGFDNLRPLNQNANKASRIYNLREQAIPLIKTFKVGYVNGKLQVSLTKDKEADWLQKLSHKTTPISFKDFRSKYPYLSSSYIKTTIETHHMNSFIVNSYDRTHQICSAEMESKVEGKVGKTPRLPVITNQTHNMRMKGQDRETGHTLNAPQTYEARMIGRESISDNIPSGSKPIKGNTERRVHQPSEEVTSITSTKGNVEEVRNGYGNTPNKVSTLSDTTNTSYIELNHIGCLKKDVVVNLVMNQEAQLSIENGLPTKELKRENSISYRSLPPFIFSKENSSSTKVTLEFNPEFIDLIRSSQKNYKTDLRRLKNLIHHLGSQSKKTRDSQITIDLRSINHLPPKLQNRLIKSAFQFYINTRVRVLLNPRSHFFNKGNLLGEANDPKYKRQSQCIQDGAIAILLNHRKRQKSSPKDKVKYLPLEQVNADLVFHSVKIKKVKQTANQRSIGVRNRLVKAQISVFDSIKHKTERVFLKCINHNPQDLHLQLIKDQLIRHREVQTIAVKSTGLVKTLALNDQLSPGLSTYEAYAVFKTRKWKFEGGWLFGQVEEGLD